MSHHDVTHLRIVMLGETGAGKSSILSQYINNTFCDSTLATIGVDVLSKTITINNKTVIIKYWDTAGQERFQGLSKSYFTGTDGIILVFDMQKKSSYDKLSYWLEKAIDIAPINKVDYILLGNKIDLENREVTTEMGMQFCKENNLKGFYEVSAKMNINLNESMSFLQMHIVNRLNIFDNTPSPNPSINITLSNNSTTKGNHRNNCC